MNIRYKICARCNQNVRRTYDQMCKACWRFDHGGADLPKPDRTTPIWRAKKHNRRWKRMPESEKARRHAEKALRKEARVKRLAARCIDVEEDLAMSFALRQSRGPEYIITKDERRNFKKARRTVHQRERRHAEREETLDAAGRRCGICRRVFAKSRSLVIRMAYKTKMERAEAFAAFLEHGVAMKVDSVICLGCHRKEKTCGSSLEMVS